MLSGRPPSENTWEWLCRNFSPLHSSDRTKHYLLQGMASFRNMTVVFIHLELSNRGLKFMTAKSDISPGTSQTMTLILLSHCGLFGRIKPEVCIFHKHLYWNFFNIPIRNTIIYRSLVQKFYNTISVWIHAICILNVALRHINKDSSECFYYFYPPVIL